jgi:hypothetical protein
VQIVIGLTVKCTNLQKRKFTFVRELVRDDIGQPALHHEFWISGYDRRRVTSLYTQPPEDNVSPMTACITAQPMRRQLPTKFT